MTGRPSTAPEAWAACADAVSPPSRAQARRDKDSVDSGATAAKRLRLEALGGCDRCGGAGAFPAAALRTATVLERRVYALCLERHRADAGVCAACSGGAGGLQPLWTRQGVLAVRDYKHPTVAYGSQRRATLFSVRCELTAPLLQSCGKLHRRLGVQAQRRCATRAAPGFCAVGLPASCGEF